MANEEGESKRADDEKDVWVPGPGSWRPGDPLPEQFKIERKKGNFPRREVE
jgi:hypothetical protein